MLSQQLSPRDQNNVANLDRVAVYIREHFAASGARVTEQPFEAAGQMYRNVIASFGPEAGERIVIGAHYDAYQRYPAADDNASGVAGLLELAGLLAKEKLTVRVDLVAYTLEEPPYFYTSHMGRECPCETPQKQESKGLMISPEMIGYFRCA